MDHHEKQEKKREALRSLRAQKRRAGDLRRRVVATSVVAFALLWAIVFAQMATGNDPVLSARSEAVATATRHGRKAEATKSGASGARAEEVEAATTERAERAARAEAAAEVEAAEAEAFVEEPAPVTTSQS